MGPTSATLAFSRSDRLLQSRRGGAAAGLLSRHPDGRTCGGLEPEQDPTGSQPQPLAGFPIEGLFATPEEIEHYFAGPEITCLLCGRHMRRLERHLRLTHRISADTYRQRYGLPWGRGLISAELRRILAETLARQPRRPLPQAAHRPRRRPRQPFERVVTFRALALDNPKKPDTRAAHEQFLARLKAGRTIRAVTRDPDMPSLAAHYAYRRRHPVYDRRVKQVLLSLPWPGRTRPRL